MYTFPKVKFVDTNTPEQQLEHIRSEVVEAIREQLKGMQGLTDLEVADIWHSCESYFRIREKQGISVNEVVGVTIEKNYRRGYYATRHTETAKLAE